MDNPDVLAWRDGCIEALDQTALPHQVRVLRIATVDQLVQAITSLAIRGAPVLGAAGALGVAAPSGAPGRRGRLGRRAPGGRDRADRHRAPDCGESQPARSGPSRPGSRTEGRR